MMEVQLSQEAERLLKEREDYLKTLDFEAAKKLPRLVDFIEVVDRLEREEAKRILG